MRDRQNTVRHGGVLADSALVTGPPRYVPRGQWQPLQALIAAVVIFLGALVAVAIPVFLGAFAYFGVPYDELVQEQQDALLTGIAIFSSAGVIALSWRAASFYGDPPREVLQLDGPAPAIAEVLAALAGYTLILSICTVVRHTADPQAFVTSFLDEATMYTTAFRDTYWPVIVPLALSTSLVNGFLTYGFLLSGMAKLNRGFWSAAVLVALLWTPLETDLPGAAQQFVVAMYLCWLTWRTGRIWLVLICELWREVVVIAIVAVRALI